MAPSTTAKAQQLALDLALVRDDNGNVDRWCAGFAITYGAFFFAGAAAIAMWSSVTLCLDFFAQQFPEQRVGFVFPVVNMSTLLIISLYMVVAGRQLPLEHRMNGALTAYLAFVLLLPLANVLPLPATAAYALTLVALVGSTVASSVLQSSMYGLGGVFGPLFVQAIEGGKGFGAILLFVIRLALKWHYQLPTLEQRAGESERSRQQAVAAQAALEAHTAKLSMAVFFSVTFGIVALTWALYAATKRTKFAEPLLEEYLMVQYETPFDVAQVLTPLSSARAGKPQFPSELSPLLDPEARGRQQQQQDEEQEQLDNDEILLLREHAASASLLAVGRVAAKPLFSLFLSYFVCLSCFPGIIAALQSTTFALADWYAIVLVGSYNLGDLVGKNLPMYVMYFDVATLHRPWLLQAAFVPFFVLAALHPMPDMVAIAAVVLLGLVTGYVATSSMVLAPSVCSEFQKEVAGMVGGLSAILGLCLGSYSGLALEALLEVLRK
ncbi:hypothetical protein PybrP1_012730 [[Pythium] brassicae (nom. inval.)]|nr:hypothetical protein PybrP1_012730 [[Pythium] brassicae (nom. inval.)]